MEIWLICFDISDDRIRNRVGKLLLGYGQRVQRSVFEIAVNNRAQLDQIRHELDGMVEDERDLRFYRLCADCRGVSQTLDGEPVAHFPAVIIL
jgi:CRISPR-associated protein Cas2